MGLLTDPAAWDDLTCRGYTRLADNPEVQMCVHRIADLVSSMTLHLMRNTEDGDVRVRDALARKVDVEPCGFMTRKAFIYHIVRCMLLEGDGNAFVLPEYSGTYLDDLIPLRPDQCAILPPQRLGGGYQVAVSGEAYQNDEILHFVLAPKPGAPWEGVGIRVPLRDVVQNLKQAAKTRNAYMSSEWKPSLIIYSEGTADEIATPEGRDTLLGRYFQSVRAGTPWIVPDELFKVEQVKPLTLKDLAINEAVEIDKRTVAGLFGVPAFFVGVGEFNAEEYNYFIRGVILPLAKNIEQELTRKLLFSPELYFRFNPRSLYAYSLPELATVSGNLADHGILTRNEARDWIGMAPLAGLSEMLMLENYLPTDRLGDQKKLMGGEKRGDANPRSEA